ncbi:MAG: HupE/UreJ family protein [Leptolyngbyaceae bacterium]|nr:HupE/UreJ family protein [Leptolyngbyaceae bacterium]
MTNPLSRLLSRWSSRRRTVAIISVFGAIALFNFLTASPAAAHHPFGGNTPTNAFQGFLSGLGHPVIGVDHLVFTIATGLLAVGIVRGGIIPVAFAATGVLGTGIHLMGLDVPAPESIISLSVVVSGLFLALRQRPSVLMIAAVAAIAGIFHGYAYGEAIIGAEMTPTFSYLLGFTLIQLAIAFTAYVVARLAVAPTQASLQASALPIRFAGFMILGAGTAFLSSVILG